MHNSVKSLRWLKHATKMSLFMGLIFLSACETTQKPAKIVTKSSAHSLLPVAAPKPQYEMKKSSEQTIVALLLPLSGQGSEIGKSVMDAAKLALFDLKAQGIVLKPYDTGSDTAKTIEQAQKAIRDGAEVFLGPVFSTTTRAITPLAQEAHIPVLSLSNTPEIANKGVYPLGFNPGEQTEHLVKYLAEKGYHRIGVFAPNTRYAQLAVDSLKNAAQKATITREVYYDRSTQHFDDHIHALLGTAPGLQTSTKDQFDALFIPERGEKLEKIVQTLNKYINTEKIRIFGPDSFKESANEPSLRGAWFAAPDAIERQKFRTRFLETYSYEPSEIATIAYDLIALIHSIRKDGYKVADDILTQEEGFNGIDGPFRLRKHGEVDRHYAIYEIAGGAARIIAPPQRNF